MKLTYSEATDKGYDVDTHVYPWFGYKGPRFAPTHSVTVLTASESEALVSLTEVAKKLEEIKELIIQLRKE